MNEEQLKMFLNGKIIVELKSIEELKLFKTYCDNHNIKYCKSILATKFTNNSKFYARIFYTGQYIYFYHESLNYGSPFETIIKFNSNLINDANKLISWIENKEVIK